MEQWLDRESTRWNVALINQSEIPESNPSCKNCAYADQYSKILFSRNSSEKEITQGTLPLF